MINLIVMDWINPIKQLIIDKIHRAAKAVKEVKKPQADVPLHHLILKRDSRFKKLIPIISRVFDLK